MYVNFILSRSCNFVQMFHALAKPDYIYTEYIQKAICGTNCSETRLNCGISAAINEGRCEAD